MMAWLIGEGLGWCGVPLPVIAPGGGWQHRTDCAAALPADNWEIAATSWETTAARPALDAATAAAGAAADAVLVGALPETMDEPAPIRRFSIDGRSGSITFPLSGDDQGAERRQPGRVRVILPRST